jgi:hypothetical protein
LTLGRKLDSVKEAGIATALLYAASFLIPVAG